jgi:hypothetical protein
LNMLNHLSEIVLHGNWINRIKEIEIRMNYETCSPFPTPSQLMVPSVQLYDVAVKSRIK